MKRWIVFGLVALAIIVLVSPGIVGKLAERNLRTSIEWAGHENEALVVTEERFERGWFTAAGRHRIEIRDGLPEGGAAKLPGDRADGTPALIIDTRIDHGLVPVTSMARDAGSLQPSLASTVSTLSLDFGEGRIVDLPGHLYSRIGLAGATDSRYRLESGSLRHEDLELEWRGADVRFAIDAGASELEYRGYLEPLEWTVGGQSSSLGMSEFAGEQQKTPYGFSTGAIALRIRDAALAAHIAGASGFENLAFDARSELVNARVSGNSSIVVERLIIPELGGIHLALDLAITGVDAASVRRIRESLDAARDAGELDAPVRGAYPLIEDDLKSLLVAGAAFRVDRFDLALPQGDVHATLQLELPETDARRFSWPGLLLALKASADVRLPAALVEMAQATSPEQARSLIAMGILKREGDDYVMKAEYAKGLVTVNGAPLPLPLGMLGNGPPDRPTPD